MNADDKIKEAEFFLQKIIENYEKDPFVEYYFHAFVISTRSISDYLLEDYKMKYGFDIPDDEKRFSEKFKKKAYALGGEAVEFHKWHDRQITKIKNDNMGSELWKKRNFIIHRRGEKLNNFSQKILHNMGIDLPKDTAIPIQGNNDEPLKFLPTTVIYLEGMAYVDLKETCERFLSLMKEMVLEAHKQFP